MNWTVLIVVGVALAALVALLIMKNRKDEKEFEQQANNDFHKSKEEEGDTDTDKPLK